MNSLLRRRSWRLVIVASAVFGLAGGIAYATIPDSTGVYTACEKTATGKIRLIDPSLGSGVLLGHCINSETQITWNQEGPRGLQGPSGPAGPSGAPGPQGETGVRGPSDAFSAFKSFAFIGTIEYQASPRFVTLAHLDLPQGAYVATAGANISSSSSDPISCFFAPTGAVSPNTFPGANAAVETQIVPVYNNPPRAHFEITAMGDGVDLVCELNGFLNYGQSYFAGNIRIDAVQVGKLTTTVLAPG